VRVQSLNPAAAPARDVAGGEPAARRLVSARPLGPEDAVAWDAYVLAHPRATFFHQLGWKRILERTFGFEPRYLVAERGGRVAGVLPLFACPAGRGRVSLLSLPHTVYGGPVGDDSEAEAALLAAARALAARLGAARLEFRNRHPNQLPLAPLRGFVTFEKALPARVDEVYRSLPKKAREALHQATKRHALRADFDGDLDVFYALLAGSFHRLGTPVFPRAFFEAIVREFPDATSILLVRHEDRAVAGVLSVGFRDLMMPLFSGEADGAARLRPNNYKYFRLMERAVERGYRRFDFGRSRIRNEGVVRFKLNQGFPMEELPYQVDGEEGGGGRADPQSRGFRIARRAWSMLPRGLATRLGPAVVRLFP
jgi:FemAB-related protein (PEP-CTERM system-associated)